MADEPHAGEPHPILDLRGWADIQEMFLQHFDPKECREAVFVSPSFYKTICHLKREKKLKLDDKAS